jgi:hypothetical protein
VTVPVQETRFPHVANGVTTDFAFGCLILSAADLHVFIDDVKITNGFTITGVGNPAGGAVSFAAAPADGVVRLERIVALQRLTNYAQSGDFLAKTVNPDFDRIWMALQQFEAYLGLKPGSTTRVLMLGPNDISGTGAYRAGSNRIRDMADPIDLQDAVTRHYFETVYTPILEALKQSAIQAAAAAAQSEGAASQSEQNSAASEEAAESAANLAETANTQVQAAIRGILPPTDSLAVGFQLAAVGSILRPIQAKLRELPSIADFDGIYGDLVNPDTVGMLAFLKAGGGYIPKCNLLIGSIDVNVPFRVVMHPEATIKWLPTATVGSLMLFRAGCSNSSWRGGIFDGNKAALAAITNTMVRIGSGTTGPANFEFADAVFKNTPGAPMVTTDTSALKVKNIRAEDCVASISFARDSGGAEIDTVKMYRTNNGGKAVFQHAFDIQGFKKATVKNVLNYDQLGDAAGLSNFSSGITGIGNEDCTFENIQDYGHATDAVFTLGLSFSGGRRNTYANIGSRGNRQNIELVGESDYLIDGYFVDGQYKKTTAVPSADSIVGLMIHSGGLYLPSGVSLSVGTPRRGSVNNGQIRRCGTGVKQRGGGVFYDGNRILGCTVDGLRTERLSSSTEYFPGATGEVIDASVFANGTIEYNGRAGVMLDYADGFSFPGTRIANNGQNTTYTADARCGIAMQTTGAKNRINICGATMEDTQNVTKTAALSYKPGITDANNQYAFTVISPGLLSIGQNVTLVNVLAGPASVTGKIVDISLDEHTIEFAAPQTFAATVNSVTGTISSNGTTVTGVGTLFTTEFIGRTWFRVGTDYRQVMKVISDLEMVIDAAFPANLAAAVAQRVRAGITLIPSQQYGMYYDQFAWNMRNGALMHGHVIANLHSATALNAFGNPPFADGEQFTLYGTGAVAAAASQTAYGSVPVGYEIVGYRFQLTADVTGTAGATLAVQFAGGAATVLASALAVVKNTKVSGSVVPTLLSANTQLQMVFSGGSDNVPDGGAYRAELMVRRSGFTPYANVP